MKVMPRLAVSRPSSRYGVDHRRRPVLDDAVDHQLHARRGVPAHRPLGPSRDQALDLLQPVVVLPPQRAHDPRRQLAAAGHPQVGRVAVGPDDGVLPVGDAQRVQVGLALDQPPVELGVAGRRDVALDEVLGALVERAQRRPVGVAGDPAVVRVRRVHGDPAISSARLLTHASWPSLLGRKTGRSGTTRSRSSRLARPPGKWARYQPLPRIHGSSGFAAAYAAIRSRYASMPARPDEVAVESVDARADRVDVAVAEPGRHRPTAEVDDPRPGAGVPHDRRVAAHGRDPAVLHRERLRPRAGRVGGEDASPGQDEVGDVIRHGTEDARGATTCATLFRRAASGLRCAP